MFLYHSRAVKPQDGGTPLSDACLQKEVKKLKEADKDGTQTIIVSELVNFPPSNFDQYFGGPVCYCTVDSKYTFVAFAVARTI